MTMALIAIYSFIAGLNAALIFNHVKGLPHLERETPWLVAAVFGIFWPAHWLWVVVK